MGENQIMTSLEVRAMCTRTLPILKPSAEDSSNIPMVDECLLFTSSQLELERHAGKSEVFAGFTQTCVKWSPFYNNLMGSLGSSHSMSLRKWNRSVKKVCTEGHRNVW